MTIQTHGAKVFSDEKQRLEKGKTVSITGPARLGRGANVGGGVTPRLTPFELRDAETVAAELVTRGCAEYPTRIKLHGVGMEDVVMCDDGYYRLAT